MHGRAPVIDKIGSFLHFSFLLMNSSHSLCNFLNRGLKTEVGSSVEFDMRDDELSASLMF